MRESHVCELSILERLRRAGWRTEAHLAQQIQRNMWFGLEPGFDRYTGHAGARLKGDSARILTAATTGAIRRLSRRAQPWALWVHYLEPHAPYAPHEAFDFGDRKIDRYDGEIAYIDHHLGRLVKSLELAGVRDRTLVVYTSDHGEEFGEHGRRHHGKQLFEESVRIPLVVHVPGVENRVRGERRRRRWPRTRAPLAARAIGVPTLNARARRWPLTRAIGFSTLNTRARRWPRTRATGVPALNTRARRWPRTRATGVFVFLCVCVFVFLCFCFCVFVF